MNYDKMNNVVYAKIVEQQKKIVRIAKQEK